MGRSYRDNYNEKAWAYCTNCGKVHSFSFGHQGNMSQCRECDGRLEYPGNEKLAREKGKEVKGE